MRRVDIIGGGLAGLSLGCGLRRAGVPVTVQESGIYPRQRTCGEFIHGLDSRAVALLGIEQVLADAAPRSTITWTHAAAPPRSWRLRRPALAVSRGELDARLAAAFHAAGGELLTARAADPAHTEPGCVFAAGRRPDRASPWFGLKVHLGGMKLSADLEFHVGHRTYVGLCRLTDDQVNLCGVFHRMSAAASGRAGDLVTHLHAGGMHALARRVSAAEIIPASTCAVAGLRFGVQPRSGALPCIGDAFVFTPPFLGRGMASAFASAASATGPLAAWSRGDLSWSEAVREIHRRQLRLHRSALGRATRIHPFLLNPALSRLAALLLHGGASPLRVLATYLNPRFPRSCFSTP